MWDALHKRSAFGEDFFLPIIIKKYKNRVVNDKNALIGLRDELRKQYDL